MENEDFDDNETCELVGNCAAYLETGSGHKEALVEYNIKFSPVGRLKYEAPPEVMVGPLDPFQVVILIPPEARKKDVLQTLVDTARMIREDGLFLGEWPTEDVNDPYKLFDQGHLLIGKLIP